MEVETNELSEDAAAVGLRPALGAARLWAHCLAEPLAGLAHLKAPWGFSLAAAGASDSTLACGQQSNLVFLGFPEPWVWFLGLTQHPSVQLVQGTCSLPVLGFQNVDPLP